MKRHLAATTIALMLATMAGVFTTPLVFGDAAWARAGGGSSGGSRGSRGFSSSPSQSRTAPNRSTAPAPAPAAPMPQRSGWGAGLMGGIGGLVLGGLIGSMLFGGMGHGFGGGFGLLEILLLGALAYFAFSFLRRRREPQPAMAGGYGTPSLPGGGQAWSSDRSAASTATLEAPAGPTDLQVGVGHIRQMDAAFDPARASAAATDIFFKVQAAWMARDMAAARDSLTPEMYERLQGQCTELRAQRRINRLENIAVRSTDVTEAWQEQGQDYVTVAFVASVLDYTTDEAGAVIDGSRTEPVRFEEYWTLVRPVGPNAWRLSAIQQA
jgi:predicted lipid-binding transport protein (Tim44 family)